MNRKVQIAATLVSLAVASPAQACLASNFEDWVFVKNRPASVPKGLSLVRVRVPQQLTAWEVTEFDLLETQDHWYAAKRIKVSPGIESSCSRWGRTGGPAYALGVMTFDEKGNWMLAAVQQPNPEAK